MLILYNYLLKKKNLINIIKINDIKNYSNLNKPGLIQIINKYKSAIYIQKFIRTKLAFETTCPITLCELTYPFISIKNNNKFRYYNFKEFVQYLNKSSNDDFRDPFTRESLTDNTLKQVETLIKYYKIKKSYNKKLFREKMNLRAEFLTITNCLNEILNDIFCIKEFSFNSIYNHILPQFIYYFHFLLNRHKNNCYTVINNYINCINYHNCENKIYLIEYLKLIISVNNL
jgi:hypothetical protein